jgi:hypothetical protein
MDYTKSIRPEPPPTFSPGQLPPPPEDALPFADYEMGSAKRPAITHDNGHLQNPMDQTDPVPVDVVAPTTADHLAVAKWRVILSGAEAIRGDLADGTAAYRHFLDGNGAARTIDYDRFLIEDPAGRAVEIAAIEEGRRAAQEQYAELLASAPGLANSQVKLSFTGGELSVGDNDAPYREYFPYPATENWQKALGGHSVWLSAEVTVTPGAEGPRFEMALTIHAEDRYNFNPDQQDLATGVPDSDNGRFEQVGLGHQYINTGEAKRSVEWTAGR